MPEWLIGAVSGRRPPVWAKTVVPPASPRTLSLAAPASLGDRLVVSRHMDKVPARLQHTVYVLRSDKDGRLYTGVTTNLTQRLRDHTAGKVASTRHRRPLRLVYSESFEDKVEAWARERYFKTAAGGTLKQRLISEQPGDSLLK